RRIFWQGGSTTIQSNRTDASEAGPKDSRGRIQVPRSSGLGAGSGGDRRSERPNPAGERGDRAAVWVYTGGAARPIRGPAALQTLPPGSGGLSTGFPDRPAGPIHRKRTRVAGSETEWRPVS